MIAFFFIGANSYLWISEFDFMINIFIIDDHPAIIAGLEFLLSEYEDRFNIAGSSTKFKEALQKLPSLKVNLIILDLYMDNNSPVVNLQRLRSKYPDIPVLIYSAEDSPIWKYRMIKAGANAFLNKSSHNDMIIDTILAISDGSVLITEDIKDILDPQKCPGQDDFLTPEEIKIGNDLSFGMNLKEISHQMDKSLSYVEKILNNLRRKTNAKSTIDLIRILLSRKLIPGFHEMLSNKK